MSECGWCGEVKPVAYTDAIGAAWCGGCYNDTFDPGCQAIVGYRYWHPSQENITCDEAVDGDSDFCEVHQGVDG